MAGGRLRAEEAQLLVGDRPRRRARLLGAARPRARVAPLGEHARHRRRQHADGQLEEDDAERVAVACEAVPVALAVQLRRDVAVRAYQPRTVVAADLRLRVDDRRKPKVRQANVAVAEHQHVRRLQIAVDDAHPSHVGEGEDEAARVEANTIERQPAGVGQVAREVAAPRDLHDHEKVRLVLPRSKVLAKEWRPPAGEEPFDHPELLVSLRVKVVGDDEGLGDLLQSKVAALCRPAGLSHQ